MTSEKTFNTFDGPNHARIYASFSLWNFNLDLHPVDFEFVYEPLRHAFRSLTLRAVVIGMRHVQLGTLQLEVIAPSRIRPNFIITDKTAVEVANYKMGNRIGELTFKNQHEFEQMIRYAENHRGVIE